MPITPIRKPSHLAWLIPLIFTVTACNPGSDSTPSDGNEGEDEDTVPPANDFTLISVNDQLWRTDAEGNAEVVSYLDTSSDGSAFPYDVETVLLNQQAFFAAWDGVHGTELWRFDGDDPVMVRDINPGSLSSHPDNLVTMDSTLYFLAATRGSGQELWRSDGTEDGTWQVKEFRYGFEDGIPSPSHSDSQVMVAADQQLYFLVESDADTLALWRSDGTYDGTHWVVDLNPERKHRLIPHGNDLYLLAFAYSDVTLQHIDGETHQPTQLKDFTGTDGSTIATAFVNDQLYLLLDKYVSQLWRSDGTSAGTTLQLESGVRCGSERTIPVLGDALFFVRKNEDDRCELLRTDGTPESSEPLKEVSSDNNVPYSIGPTVTLGSALYFILERYDTGHQLWKTNGTLEGTVVIEGITGNLADASLTGLHKVGSALYLTAIIDGGSGELWRTDGSIGGANRVASLDDSYPGLRHNDVFALGQNLYFVANGTSEGAELWTSDGTETGTQLASNINQTHPASWPTVALSGYRETTTRLNGVDYFTAEDSVHGRALWRSNGTEAGTQRVKDVFGDWERKGIQDLTTLGSTVYFRVDGGYDSQLWRSDGTESGTVPILSAEGEALYYVDNLTVLNDLLFFEAQLDDEFYSRLWRSDGTQDGTYPLTGAGSLADVTVVAPSFMVHDSTLYFEASESVHGSELWRSDGTETGTYLVKDIYNGEYENYVVPLGVLGSHLYFSAREELYGDELWRTDGTAEGTHRVKDINPGSNGSSPEDFTVLGSVAYFIVYLDGYRLWRTDGTEAGTYQVTDITSSDGGIAAFKEHIYFTGNTTEHGTELWKTDGTVDGAELLIDVIQGPEGGDPDNLTVIGNRLYFIAEPKYGSGYSTWVSDGTQEGTRLVE